MVVSATYTDAHAQPDAIADAMRPGVSTMTGHLRRRYDPLVAGHVDSERLLLAALGPLARRREFVLLVNSSRAIARHANDVGIGQRRWTDHDAASAL